MKSTDRWISTNLLPPTDLDEHEFWSQMMSRAIFAPGPWFHEADPVDSLTDMELYIELLSLDKAEG